MNKSQIRKSIKIPKYKGKIIKNENIKINKTKDMFKLLIKSNSNFKQKMNR